MQARVCEGLLLRDWRLPLQGLQRGYTTYIVGSKVCVTSLDNSDSDSSNSDPRNCPVRTEWVKDSDTEGCRPLCRLGWYNKDTGAWPCRKCPSGTTTETPGSSECVEDPTLDSKDGHTKEECSEGYVRVKIGWDVSSKCMRECKKGEFSPSGVVPCKPCKAGYSTRGPGATTCIKDAPSYAKEKKSSTSLEELHNSNSDSGESRDRDFAGPSGGDPAVSRRLTKAHVPVSRHLADASDIGSGSDIPNSDKQCADGTIWVEKTAEHPAGCKPQCRPGTYSANGIYPCHSCKDGYTTKRWGEKMCHPVNEADKGCPEGMKWFVDKDGDGYCIKDIVCPRMYYSVDGSTPCMRCPEGTTTYTAGAKYCSDKSDQQPSDDDSTTGDSSDMTMMSRTTMKMQRSAPTAPCGLRRICEGLQTYVQPWLLQ